MTPAELGGHVLASVSRSFYLSIRLLPPCLREPIGLAYLLARASDTIADSNASPAAERLQHLEYFGQLVEGADRAGLSKLQGDILPPKPEEAILIAELRPVLDWLAALDQPAREEIQRVMRLIVHGQRLDLQRFPGPPQLEIRALANASELDEYTYLVAGCVGEFWTRICLQRLGARYSRESADELCRLGAGFGRALQLVNILRDLPDDLRDGRCYLPADEWQAVGLHTGGLLANPPAAAEVYEHWRQRAESLLEEGRTYILAIRPARVRAACFLPWYLGVATLALLRATPPLATRNRVKVTRGYVYGGLLRALFAGFSDAPLRARRRA